MNEQAQQTPAITIDRVTKTFGTGPRALVALDAVSLQVARGAFHTLLGPSGCGKTTLLRLIAGFEAPTSGHIRIGERDVSRTAPHQRPVNTVFQSYALFPHMSVAGNIGFGLKMQGRPRAEVKSRVAEMLAMVRMEDFADRLVHQLSGGQQQRIALARALAPAPEVLLLDEPLSALDLKLRREMQSELKRLQRETGITFVFVTHDQEEALTMSDRVSVMSQGRIQQTGSPQEIYAHPANRFVSGFIGESNFIEAVSDGRVARIAGGVFQLGADAPAGPVTLAIRPEALRLLPEGQGVAATLRDTTYLGNAVTLLGVLADGTEVTLRQSPDAPVPEIGTTLSLGAAPEAIQVLQS